MGSDLLITITTDVPCHLWLFWTDQEMRIHNDPVRWRGISMPSHPRYCFVEWDKIDQDEAGDTLLHHFTFPGWYFCLRRWYIFSGTIAGNRSPSASPIINAHCATYIKDESMRHIDLTDKEVAGVIDHADGSVTAAKLKYPFTFSAFPFTPVAAPTADYEVANKKYVDDAIPPPTPTWEECQMMTYQASVSGAWDTITLPAWWPGDVVALDVQLENWEPVGTRQLGVREVGSAIDRRTGMWPHTMVNWRVNVNVAQQFQVYAQDRLTAWFRLIGRYR